MKNPPTGTVTFLFTDIESSTRLWQEYPDQMKLNLEKHDTVMRQAIERNEGYVFKTVGDAFCAAFPTPLQGIKTAVESQQTLTQTAWGECVIKVRMGLHTGDAEERDNDYFGNTVNRVARLMSAGHGGQTLISLATQELIRDKLPNGISLVDLGERHLKDLIRPEHIYQLNIVGLKDSFPPLKTLDAYRHNLPAQTTSFIGREKEIAKIKQSIGEHRLVTLTGPGGTGKSRLSLQVAADLLDQFPNGIWFVELAPITDPDLIPQTILSAADMQIQPGRSALDSLMDFLREKTSLVVLDNCEHLIEACAKLADTLLSTAPNLKILASSREALGVKGEMAWRVPSLSIPDLQHLPAVEQLSQYEAVRLFIERAKLVQQNFIVTNDNASAVAQICFRLDGIPLAIELAAARVKVLKAEKIAERLNDRFRLLTGGSRTALPRQQTLRALIDWSYDLLPENEKLLLRRLAVFMGGWTLEAAEQVCSDKRIRADDILDFLTHLVDKSLVVVDEHPDHLRYRMLETVRQYAREKLFESGEGEMLRDKHMKAFVELAENAEPEIRSFNQMIWLDHLEEEIDNLRAALEWARERNPELFLQMASALWRFWEYRSHFSDRGWLPAALTATQGLSTLLRARALGREALTAAASDNGQQAEIFSKEAEELSLLFNDKPSLALAVTMQGRVETDPEKSLKLLGQGLKVAKEAGDTWITSLCLLYHSNPLMDLNKFEVAQSILEEGLHEARNIGDKRLIGLGLFFIGNLKSLQGDFLQAEKLFEEAYETGQTLRDGFIIFRCHTSLLSMKLLREDYAGAREMTTRGFQLAESNAYFSVNAHWDAALIELASGDASKAIDLLEEALRLAKQIGSAGWIYDIHVMMGAGHRRNQNFVAAIAEYREIFALYQAGNRDALEAFHYDCLDGLGMLAIEQGQVLKGALLFGAKSAIAIPKFERSYPFQVREREGFIQQAREQLGEENFSRIWADGQTMTLEQAIAYALEETV